MIQCLWLTLDFTFAHTQLNKVEDEIPNSLGVPLSVIRFILTANIHTDTAT